MCAGATGTKERILQNAKAAFLANGFAGASLRAIAADAGVTTGALYRHFSGKAALFEALVAPCFHEVVAMYHTSAGVFMADLEQDGMCWSSSEQSLLQWVTYIYDHLDIFRLLLLSAEKTAYENFTHMLIDMEVDTMLAYMRAAREKNYPLPDVSREELHLFVNAQFSTLFELVLHGIPREKALQFAKNINQFFVAGWRRLFALA